MEPESPSPYPQVPATCLYPEPTPPSPHDPSNFLKIHLNIILPSTSWSPQWPLPQASPPTPCAHLYPPPYAPHALPISFVSLLPPAQYRVRSVATRLQYEYPGLEFRQGKLIFHSSKNTQTSSGAHPASVQRVPAFILGGKVAGA